MNKFDINKIKEAAYTGVGCAISQASTSIMIDLIKGKMCSTSMAYIERSC